MQYVRQNIIISDIYIVLYTQRNVMHIADPFDGAYICYIYDGQHGLI